MHLKIHNNVRWIILASTLIFFGSISFWGTTNSGAILRPFFVVSALLITCFFYSYFFLRGMNNYILLLIISFIPIYMAILQVTPEVIAVMIIISCIYDNLLNIHLHQDTHHVIKLGFLFVMFFILTENMYFFICSISFYLFFSLKDVFDRKYILNILMVYYFPLMLFLLSVYYIKVEFHQLSFLPLLSGSAMRGYCLSKSIQLYTYTITFYSVMVYSVVGWMVSSIFIFKKIKLKYESVLLIIFSVVMAMYYIALNPEKWFLYFSLLLYSLPLCIYKHYMLIHRG